MINYFLHTNAINSYLITYWLLIKSYSFLLNNSQIFPLRFQVCNIVYTVIAEALAWKNPYKNFSLNTCLSIAMYWHFVHLNLPSYLKSYSTFFPWPSLNLPKEDIALVSSSLSISYKCAHACFQIWFWNLNNSFSRK